MKVLFLKPHGLFQIVTNIGLNQDFLALLFLKDIRKTVIANLYLQEQDY